MAPDLCDKLDPAVTVNILNGYFKRMNAAIGRHHGRHALNKFCVTGNPINVASRV